MATQEQLEQLAAMGEELAAQRDREAFFLLAVQSARRLTGAAYSSIGLLEGDVIHWQSAAGKPIEEVKGVRQPVSQGLCGWVARYGRSRRTADVVKEPDYFLQYAEMRSELDVPVIVGRRVIAVLSTESPEANAFTAEHEALLQILAGHIATGWQRALLREPDSAAGEGHRQGPQLPDN